MDSTAFDVVTTTSCDEGSAQKRTSEAILSVRAWTPSLFSFGTTRDPGFPFVPGQFARIGIATSTGGRCGVPIPSLPPPMTSGWSSSPWSSPKGIPQLIQDGRLEEAAEVGLDLERSRLMICGNPQMARDLRDQLTGCGFRTGRRNAPGSSHSKTTGESIP